MGKVILPPEADAIYELIEGDTREIKIYNEFQIQLYKVKPILVFKNKLGDLRAVVNGGGRYYVVGSHEGSPRWIILPNWTASIVNAVAQYIRTKREREDEEKWPFPVPQK